MPYQTISGSSKKMGKTAIDDLLDLDEYDPDYLENMNNNIPKPQYKAIRGGNMRTMLNDNQSGMQGLPDDFPQTLGPLQKQKMLEQQQNPFMQHREMPKNIPLKSSQGIGMSPGNHGMGRGGPNPNTMSYHPHAAPQPHGAPLSHPHGASNPRPNMGMHQQPQIVEGFHPSAPLSCQKVCDHVTGCKICKKYYDTDRTIYIIVIVILIIICLLLLKKALNV